MQMVPFQIGEPTWVKGQRWEPACSVLFSSAQTLCCELPCFVITSMLGWTDSSKAVSQDKPSPLKSFTSWQKLTHQRTSIIHKTCFSCNRGGAFTIDWANGIISEVFREESAICSTHHDLRLDGMRQRVAEHKAGQMTGQSWARILGTSRTKSRRHYVWIAGGEMNGDQVKKECF